MEPTHASVDVLNASKLSCVLEDVDDAGVAGARQYDQALAAHVDGKALLEVGDSLNLTGNQDGTVQQERRSTFLDDLPSVADKILMARRRHVNLRARWEDHAPIAPSR